MSRLLLFLFLVIGISGCAGCSKSGNKKKTTTKQEQNISTIRESSKNIVQMERSEGGTYILPVIVNGVKMNFIFDTGAAVISMSSTEFAFLLKQKTFTEDDFLDISRMQDAVGNITEGLIVNLKEVQIGDKKLYNVKANVFDNQEAPLLLGQSALEQFGTITIDNSKQQLILK